MTIDSLIVTLTKVTKTDKSFFQSFIDEDLFDDYDEFEEFMDVESNELIYEFNDLEEIFQLAAQLSPLYFGKSDLYKFQGKFYLVFKDPEKLLESSIGTIGEYGNITRFHDCLLAERGEVMIKNDALKNSPKYKALFRALFYDARGRFLAPRLIHRHPLWIK